jgi:hypothetical protein
MPFDPLSCVVGVLLGVALMWVGLAVSMVTEG